MKFKPEVIDAEIIQSLNINTFLRQRHEKIVLTILFAVVFGFPFVGIILLRVHYPPCQYPGLWNRSIEELDCPTVVK